MANDLGDFLTCTLNTIDYNFNNRQYRCTSGFHDLDEALCGFLKSQLTILAGRPSMGKTAFALNMASNFALNSKVLFISCEMNYELITQRILASESEMSLHKILHGDLDGSGWKKITETIDSPRYSSMNKNLQIIPSFTDKFDKLKELVDKFSSENPNSVVIIDYFQLLNRKEKAQDRYVELADLASSIKRLAVENDTHIILLSQISRKIEERNNKKPQISDLSECDALAQHADNVLFIHRDEYWDEDNPELKNKATIIVSKVKNSAPCEIDLLFSKVATRFKNKVRISLD